MGFIKTVILVLILLIAGLLVFIYSGTYNIAATEPHSLLVEWVFDAAKKYSIRKHSENIARPKLNDDTLVRSGFDHYEDMCVGCHGAPGIEPAQGFNPSPPKLAEQAEQLSSVELFWVTKNGIKWTGMPAFGPSHSDQEIWAIVAFLKQLPDLTPEDYKALKQSGSFDFDIPPEDEEFYKY